MFDDKYLISRAKLTHPAWVLYKDKTDYIGRIGTGPMEDTSKPYKPWSDPTLPDVKRFSIFTGGGGEELKDVIYWVLGEGNLPIDDQRVKDFYLHNDAWRAYETIAQYRFVFHRGVPWGRKISVPRVDALAANFANAGDLEFSYPHPLKLNVSTESVILLPTYVSGKNEVVGIAYGAFIRGLPKVTAIADKLEVIQGILNNALFTDADKLSAITTICTTFDQGPLPVLGQKGLLAEGPASEGSMKDKIASSGYAPHFTNAPAINFNPMHGIERVFGAKEKEEPNEERLKKAIIGDRINTVL